MYVSCHRTLAEVKRTTVSSFLSPIMRVLEVELRLLGLVVPSLYPLSHLSGLFGSLSS